MILVDTSVWIDHLRHTDERLADLLVRGQVLVHPFVTGEIALGSLRQRSLILSLLQELPAAVAATDDEVLQLIEHGPLAGLGIGYIDAHLLAATRLTPAARLWTRDKRLRAAGQSTGVAIVDW